MPRRRVEASRYITPMREGGSMPGLLQASDGRDYVVKMRGAGQGPLVLVTEFLCAAIAEALELPVPETVIVEVPDRFGINEADPEIRDLLRTSAGANLGLDFLPEATTFDPAAGDTLPEGLAARIVWFDSFVLNVDRTARNPNLLLQRGRPFLIDNGAALYPQYTPETFLHKATLPFAQIRTHLLLDMAFGFERVAAHSREMLSEALIEDAVQGVPDDLWPAEGEAAAAPIHELQTRYRAFLTSRLRHASIFEEEVNRVRAEVQAGL